MKLLSLMLFCVLIGDALASLAFVPLALLQLSQPAFGFFGLFRRRTSPKIVEKENAEPKGPVKFSPGFSNPGFMSSFGANPGFGGGMFQGNRFQMPHQFFPQFPPGMFSQNNFQRQPTFQPPTQQFQNPGKPFQPPTQQFQNPEKPFQGSNVENPERPFEEPPQFQSPENDVQTDGMEFEDDSQQEPTINAEEAESFFTLLAETDEHKCISRLVCELGADPENAGDLGTTISEIIGSLSNFPEGSKVSEYNHILQKGKEEGLSSCTSEYSVCDHESYQLMRDAQTDQGEDSSE